MKKHVLSLVLLLSMCSAVAMEPREAKRAAFLVALAEGTLSLEVGDKANNYQLCFPGLNDEKQSVEVASLDSFSVAAMNCLKKVTTKRQAKKVFRGITDEQAYSIFAAHKIFVSMADLKASHDPLFEDNKLSKFKNHPNEHVRNEFTTRRQTLLKAMELKHLHNIKVLLAQPMQPWKKPLHTLVREKLASGQIKRAE